MNAVQEFAGRLISNLETTIVGKRGPVEQATICLLSQGHLLLEDVPGVGKTVLAKSLARSLGCSFKRIQFTPDMLPSDVTGVTIYNQATQEFEFKPGPIMAQILLTDEINRATPKTQSALLEAMQESQVTVDGVTHALPEPFMVLATQNPIEYEGTFPLPEAQRDRFLMRIRIGYPASADERALLELQKFQHPLEALEPVTQVEELLAMQAAVRAVHLSEAVGQYIVEIANATREHPQLSLGASPRGSLGLYRTGQARAAIRGRDYVLPDDIKALAAPVLAHRLIVSPAAQLRDINAEEVIREMLQTLPVPPDKSLHRAAAG